ncbi:SRPBCC family protein [Bernardetia sp. ABR2-2B]|uniref:SRPBCC family protein n=1 Tax=Bernardetia sp. ABR2-2B TaxID=3127472 RepID=UPI0030CF782E
MNFSVQKSIVFLVLSFFLFSFGFQQKNPKNEYPNPVLVKTQVVDASAKETWKVVAQFDNLAELTPNFLHSVKIKGKIGEGCERTCTSPDQKSFYKEKVTHFNKKEMYYRYALTEGSIPVKNMDNSFRVIPLGKTQSLIVWTTSYDYVENPNMSKEKLAGFMNAAITEMLTNINITTSKS